MYIDFIIPFEDARRAAILAEQAAGASEPELFLRTREESSVREEYRLEGVIGGGHFAQAA